MLNINKKNLDIKITEVKLCSYKIIFEKMCIKLFLLK